MRSVLSTPFSPTPVPILRAQGNRHFLVGITVGLLMAGLVLSLAQQGTRGLVVAVVAWVMATVLNHDTCNIFSAIDAGADEREQRLRDRTHRLWTLTFVIGVIGGGFWGAYTADPLLEQFTVTESLGLTLCFGTLTLGLPITILAWLEPGPIPED